MPRQSHMKLKLTQFAKEFGQPIQLDDHVKEILLENKNDDKKAKEQLRAHLFKKNRKAASPEEVEHRKNLCLLFERRRVSAGVDRERLSNQINEVALLRSSSHNIPNLYDLHGFLPQRAWEFAFEKYREAKWNGIPKIEFMTGQGGHSENGIAAIKKKLLEEFKKCTDCQCSVHPSNKGILVLDLKYSKNPNGFARRR